MDPGLIPSTPTVTNFSSDLDISDDSICSKHTQLAETVFPKMRADETSLLAYLCFWIY